MSLDDARMSVMGKPPQRMCVRTSRELHTFVGSKNHDQLPSSSSEVAEPEETFPDTVPREKDRRRSAATYGLLSTGTVYQASCFAPTTRREHRFELGIRRFANCTTYRADLDGCLP